MTTKDFATWPSRKLRDFGGFLFGKPPKPAISQVVCPHAVGRKAASAPPKPPSTVCEDTVDCLLASTALEATQVAALIFFVIQLLLQLIHYDPSRIGLGSISHTFFDPVKDQPVGLTFIKAILILLVSVNTVRYFWSSFLVEADSSFKEIKRYELPRFWGVIEYMLRLASLGVLYLIPMILTVEIRAEHFEVLLIVLWGSLVCWDLIILCHTPVGSSFRDTLQFWLRIEAIGFFMSTFYWIALTYIPPVEVVLTILCVSFFSFSFLALALVDIYRNRGSYLNPNSLGRLAMAACMGVPMFFVLNAYL